MVHNGACKHSIVEYLGEIGQMLPSNLLAMQFSFDTTVLTMTCLVQWYNIIYYLVYHKVSCS